jgi:hypothetical protein
VTIGEDQCMAELSRHLAVISLAVLGLLIPHSATAQISRAGYSNPIFDEDFVERIPGPDIGDYAGLPITDAARTRANTWDASLRRNGVPYRENSVVTEYFDRFPVPNGGEWFVVTTVVDDPTYLLRPFVTSSHFRREPDDPRWQPKPCKM